MTLAAHLKALVQLGLAIPEGGRVLDLGCGSGSNVRALLGLGYDAHGCDLAFRPGPHLDHLQREGRLSLFPLSPYRLPFPDAHFDAIVSFSVMEHVANYDETIAEMRRVLKPGGVTLHEFPSRWRPIEPHRLVPLSGVFQSRPWLALWAYLGVRAPSQRGKGPQTVLAENLTYLTTGTNYLSGPQLRAAFRKGFSHVQFAERTFLANSTGRAGRLVFPAGRVFPPLFALYRFMFRRIIVAT